MQTLIPATDSARWRETLLAISKTDVCQLPEYHEAYAGRFEGAQALLWSFQSEDRFFCYPFMKTPVVLSFENGKRMETDYCDLTSVYGYSGPITNSNEPEFIKSAWEEFEAWSKENKVLAEFIRFSIFAENTQYAHPKVHVEQNRQAAVSYLPETEKALLTALGGKTRNMLKKAERSGLVARELPFREWLPEFRRLYEQTMQRNSAGSFFYYDDTYYGHLLNLKDKECLLFGVFKDETLVSTAIALIYGECALYHLGASLQEYVREGAGNLALFHMSCRLQDLGVRFLNLGGGRTTASDDPLLGFKKRNATGLADFFIGKRIHEEKAYRELQDTWNNEEKNDVDFSKIIFYR